MQFELIVVKNAMAFACDSTDCEILRGDDLFGLVQSVYPNGQPLNTYWYQDKWDSDCDVTPQSAADIIVLNEQGGTIYLVTYPAAAVAPWVIQAAISVLVSVAVAFLMPAPKAPNQYNSQPPSPNNSLTRRNNTPRLGGRVPDIYGTLIAVPDLLAENYIIFVDNEEVEFSYYSLGRGVYDVKTIMDDTTNVADIQGSTVQVFNPNLNIKTDEPTKMVGQPFIERERLLSKLAVKRYSAVNGQTLKSPETGDVSSGKMVFISPNRITTLDNSIDFSKFFSAGQGVTLTTVGLATSVNIQEGLTNPQVFNFNGGYIVQSATSSSLYLSSPSAVSPDWARFDDTADSTHPVSGTILGNQAGVDPTWSDPVVTDDDLATGAMVNFIAPQGIYTVHPDGDKYAPFGVTLEVKSERLDSLGNTIANSTEITRIGIAGRGAVLSGGVYQLTTSEEARRSVGQTSFINRAGRLRLWFRRYSREKVPNPPQQYFEEIKIKDLYSYRLINSGSAAIDPDSTRLYGKSQNTESALSVKDRSLRVLVQRQLRDWRGGYIYSNRIDHIIYNIATDPITGGVAASALNMQQISAEVDAQISYFGTDFCAQFCGTFDNSEITTEEMIQTVAQAGFFTAYRVNNKIHLHFERPQDYAIANFNSHNITPDSFEYSESFGARNDYDGVEVTYTDPDNNDVRQIMRYPDGGYALNPQKIELVGVRNKVQARVHMMRAHWKNQLAYSTCEFTGADESGIVIPTNRINVANQNNADTQQGAIESLEVIGGQTVLMLSDTVDFGNKAQATIFVQTVSGVVDNIRCYPRDEYSVVLSRAPSQPLSTAWDAVVRATYQFVTHDDLQRDSYIVTAKDVGENPLSHRLTCINYDSRYYQNDSDFKNGWI